MSVEIKMSSTKYDIEKFTVVNDFDLNHLNMEALLVQRGLLEAFKGPEKMDVSLITNEKTTMIEKAHNGIILSLGVKVLRHVSKEKVTVGVWIVTPFYPTK